MLFVSFQVKTYTSDASRADAEDRPLDYRYAQTMYNRIVTDHDLLPDIDCNSEVRLRAYEPSVYSDGSFLYSYNYFLT